MSEDSSTEFPYYLRIHCGHSVGLNLSNVTRSYRILNERLPPNKGYVLQLFLDPENNARTCGVRAVGKIEATILSVFLFRFNCTEVWRGTFLSDRYFWWILNLCVAIKIIGLNRGKLPSRGSEACIIIEVTTYSKGCPYYVSFIFFWIGPIFKQLKPYFYHSALE